MAPSIELVQEAILADEALKSGLPKLYQNHYPLLSNLLCFFITSFDFNVSPDALPAHNIFETEEVSEIRTAVVSEMISQYQQEFGGQGTMSDKRRIIRLGTTVLYWYLKDLNAKDIRERKQNRTQRRGLGEYANRIAPQEQVKTTIDYRSEHPLEEYTTLAKIADIQPRGPPMLYYNDYANIAVGFDDTILDNKLGKSKPTPGTERLPRMQLGKHKASIKETCSMKTFTIDNPELFSIRPAQQRGQRQIAGGVARPKVEKPKEAQFIVPCLGKVDYIRVLVRVLEVTERKQSADTANFLEAFEEGIEGLNDLQRIGGDPETLRAPGVYLHALWKNSKEFWIYIGQALALSDRIGDHNNVGYRKRHPSLHYHTWNSFEDVGSIFVKLLSFDGYELQGSDVQDFQGESLHYLLNLAEMWLCCAFQSLSPTALRDFLPADTPIIWAGLHLNVLPMKLLAGKPLWTIFSLKIPL
ncbi:hypothetical protein BDW59DRAFT_163105 [Aspergillus cavernicola]|uniref:Fungal-type protein kinase domain-containing protein n=1 Tax=Aspergillus cavernicola TaxID=176166 RepID=A0ABR4I9K0_9EURO